MKKVKNKKTQLMKQADHLWFDILMKPICEVCGGIACSVHHYYYKGSFAHLRYDLENGIPICISCHYKIHFKDPKPWEEIIENKRGKEWTDRMELKSKNRQSSFKTVKYYEDTIEYFKKINDSKTEDN